jgi:glycosyltransferase involved in cell wall biosynthesis
LIVDYETGLLFRSGDVIELANMIAYLLERPEEAKRMGANTRKFVEEKFSIREVINMLEKIYMEVLL